MLLILKPLLNLFGLSPYLLPWLCKKRFKGKRCLNQWMKGSALLFSHYPDINDLGNLFRKDSGRVNECINYLVIYFLTDYSGHNSFSGIYVNGCPRMSVTFNPKERNQPVRHGPRHFSPAHHVTGH